MRPDALDELLLICQLKVVAETADVICTVLIASEEEWHVKKVTFLANVASNVIAKGMLTLLPQNMLLAAGGYADLPRDPLAGR